MTLMASLVTLAMRLFLCMLTMTMVLKRILRMKPIGDFIMLQGTLSIILLLKANTINPARKAVPNLAMNLVLFDPPVNRATGFILVFSL